MIFELNIVSFVSIGRSTGFANSSTVLAASVQKSSLTGHSYKGHRLKKKILIILFLFFTEISPVKILTPLKFSQQNNTFII